MKNHYHDMMERIHTPEELTDRVLSAVHQRGEKTAAPRRRRPVLRVAACAVLALTLVLGTVTLRPAEKDGEKIQYSESPDVLPFTLTYEFGLAARAADVGGVNGGLAFAWVEDGADFRIEGTGIETISLSIDKGELWRAGICFGQQVTEPFDSSAIYGLRLAEGEGDISVFDGAMLQVTAVFADGVEQTKSFALSTGDFRVTRNEDGVATYFLTLAGDTVDTISGLYVSSEKSRWFSWPVEGANTVSLSAPYGGWVVWHPTDPVGTATGFHSGIDIPAEQETPITAAASGTVTETGFDAERGNYLVLDHGDGLTTLYGQCQEVLTEVGDAVEAGETVALVGTTGKATGPHLHFEVRQDGEAQNPVAYFDAAIRDTLQMG